MLADGLTKIGIDLLLLRNFRHDCNYDAKHLALIPSKTLNIGSATVSSPAKEDVGFQPRMIFMDRRMVGLEHRM